MNEIMKNYKDTVKDHGLVEMLRKSELGTKEYL